MNDTEFRRAVAGKKYRPCNGTEGMIFDDEWCERCIHDRKYRETQDGKDGCKIIAAVLMHEVDEPEYPPEWVYDSEGYPCCTAFIDKGSGDNPTPDPAPFNPDQQVLFFVPRSKAAPEPILSALALIHAVEESDRLATPTARERGGQHKESE